MTTVFISHSGDDREYVENELVPLLHSVGLKTWYSINDVRPSEIFEREILGALEKCEWFLLVMSPSAAGSSWVISETSWAVSHRWGRIVPLLYQDCESLSFHLRLPEIQHLDFRIKSENAVRQLLHTFELPQPITMTKTQIDQVCPTTSSITSQQMHAPRAHFHCGPWVPAEFFIGREDELSEARHLIASKQSFLIVGHPRAGKTSFCRKLKREYESDPNSDILICYFNLQQCSELTIETFLEHTILNIVGEIARKLFGCRYMDLKRASPSDGYPELANDLLFSSFVDIFRLVSERTHIQGGSHPSPLTSHEFVHLTTDLLEIASEKRRRGFVILYDEANRLPIDVSGNLLLSIGETLNETGVAGVYVASPEMESRFEKLDQLFGARLVLGPFHSPDEMKQLLARYYFDDIAAVADLPATIDALNLLWKISGGVPFLIQLIADRSFRLARAQQCSMLSAPHIEEAFRLTTAERPAAFRNVQE